MERKSILEDLLHPFEAKVRASQDLSELEDQVLSIRILQTPFHLLSFTLSLSNFFNESVCKRPTLSIEEHIRQCEAMTDKVKGASQFNTLPGIFPVDLPSTLKVDWNSIAKPPSLTIHFSITNFQERLQVVEATTWPSILSSSTTKNPSLTNLHDVGGGAYYRATNDDSSCKLTSIVRGSYQLRFRKAKKDISIKVIVLKNH